MANMLWQTSDRASLGILCRSDINLVHQMVLDLYANIVLEYQSIKELLKY